MADPAAVRVVKRLRLRRDGVIYDVCSACGNKCCFQMTMMGSQDLRVLLKEMLLEGELELQVRAGLRERADELDADLRALEVTTEELSAASADDDHPDEMAALREGLEQWREFLEFLRSDFPLEMSQMLRLLYFSAIRSNTLNALLRIPAGPQALVRHSLGRASFRMSGPRRFAPPACLFYLSTVGCIAGEGKPAKCANFFCTGEPNVLGELRDALSFDDFVLSYFVVTDIDRLLARIVNERELGPEFVDPKIVLGVDDDDVHRIASALGERGERLEVKWLGERSPRSADEIEQEIGEMRPPEGLIEVYDSVDGNALYELALALDQIRLRDLHPSYVLATRRLHPAPVPHPMWDENMMAQPLGGLGMYVLDVPRAES